MLRHRPVLVLGRRTWAPGAGQTRRAVNQVNLTSPSPGTGRYLPLGSDAVKNRGEASAQQGKGRPQRAAGRAAEAAPRLLAGALTPHPEEHGRRPQDDPGSCGGRAASLPPQTGRFGALPTSSTGAPTLARQEGQAPKRGACARCRVPRSPAAAAGCGSRRQTGRRGELREKGDHAARLGSTPSSTRADHAAWVPHARPPPPPPGPLGTRTTRRTLALPLFPPRANSGGTLSAQ